MTRARCADLESVRVYSANYSELDERAAFDLVTLIGVLEYGHLYHPEHRRPARGGGRQPARPRATRSRTTARSCSRSRTARPQVPQRRARGPLGPPVRGRSRATGHADTPVTFSARELRGAAGEAGFAAAAFLRAVPGLQAGDARSSTPRPARTSTASTTGSPARRPTAAPSAARCSTTSASPPARWPGRPARRPRELVPGRRLPRARRDASEAPGHRPRVGARHYSLDRRGGLRKRATLRGEARRARARAVRRRRGGRRARRGRPPSASSHEPAPSRYARGDSSCSACSSDRRRGRRARWTVRRARARARATGCSSATAPAADGRAGAGARRGVRRDLVERRRRPGRRDARGHRRRVALDAPVPADFVVWRMPAPLLPAQPAPAPRARAAAWTPAAFADQWLQQVAGTVLARAAGRLRRARPGDRAERRARPAARRRAGADRDAARARRAGRAPDRARRRRRAGRGRRAAERATSTRSLRRPAHARAARRGRARPPRSRSALQAGAAAARLEADGAADVMLADEPPERRGLGAAGGERVAVVADAPPDPRHGGLPRFGGGRARGPAGAGRLGARSAEADVADGAAAVAAVGPLRRRGRRSCPRSCGSCRRRRPTRRRRCARPRRSGRRAAGVRAGGDRLAGRWAQAHTSSTRPKPWPESPSGTPAWRAAQETKYAHHGPTPEPAVAWRYWAMRGESLEPGGCSATPTSARIGVEDRLPGGRAGADVAPRRGGAVPAAGRGACSALEKLAVAACWRRRRGPAAAAEAPGGSAMRASAMSRLTSGGERLRARPRASTVGPAARRRPRCCGARRRAPGGGADALAQLASSTSASRCSRTSAGVAAWKPVTPCSISG